VIEFAFPWALALLAFAVIPLVRQPAQRHVYSWLNLLPRDMLSNVANVALRVLHAAAIALVAVALAGPHRRDEPVERYGRGAEIVLLLDRSRSMEQPFVTPGVNLEQQRVMRRPGGEPKASVARRLLEEFVRNRRDDRFALVAFSTQPIPVLPLTRKPELISAALAASDLSPALGDTEIGGALLGALATFDGQPYRGSRVVVLASDGGGHVDEPTRLAIAGELQRARVTLYWLYIRSPGSPTLQSDPRESSGDADAIAEQALHRFFSSTGTPYRAFQADNPEALRDAIAEVGRLESSPLLYPELLPRRDLAGGFYGAALIAVAVLLLARLLELQKWR